jgi:hypothetical protein
MRPNDSSLGRDTDVPNLLKKFFFWMEELIGLRTSYDAFKRAFAGLRSLATPLDAPLRSRVLRGRRSSFPVNW